MKIAVAGTGYVGLVTGVCLAEHGHLVTCVDVDEKKVELMKKMCIRDRWRRIASEGDCV